MKMHDLRKCVFFGMLFVSASAWAAGLPGDAEAAAHAFHALQGIRLAAQASAVVAGAAPGNQIDPDSLNEFDRRLLLETLRQARSLQQRLKTRFQIDS